MVRLRNEKTGVVVRVDDALASSLGAEWVAADQPARTAKAKGKASSDAKSRTV